jgi:hypothetical protein
MYTGGIETLILRMSDWLIKNDHNVDLLLMRKGGELLSKIHKDVNIFSLGSFPEWSFLKMYLKNNIKCQYDVIYSFSPLTTWMSLLIAKKCTNNPVVLNGVYHPYDYRIFADYYQKNVFDKKLPDRCKVFMTPLVKEEHERILGRNIVNPIIWPLPIVTSNFKSIIRQPHRFKIVSIGRLENFKTYNILMLDVVKELLMANYDVTYYIYGDGLLLDSVKTRINSLGLEKNVFLCGTIEYDKIPDVLSNAYAFIGMGTSVIEAGLCKVPSITAIAYAQEPITHGYIHDLNKNNCGEYDNILPVYKIKDLLLNLFRMKEDEYNTLCKISYYSLEKQYDINILMPELISSIDGIKKENIALPNICPPFLYILFKKLKEKAASFKRIISI